MLFLLTVPANNTRGPRYTEKALAAIHQAQLPHAVTLLFDSHESQTGLFVRCNPADRAAVIEPIVASYPQPTVTLIEEGSQARHHQPLGLSPRLSGAQSSRDCPGAEDCEPDQANQPGAGTAGRVWMKSCR